MRPSPVEDEIASETRRMGLGFFIPEIYISQRLLSRKKARKNRLDKINRI
jgi:hypothetical protein